MNVPSYAYGFPTMRRVQLAAVKEGLFHPNLPTFRRMDMDTAGHKLPDEHCRTTSTSGPGKYYDKVSTDNHYLIIVRKNRRIGSHKMFYKYVILWPAAHKWASVACNFTFPASQWINLLLSFIDPNLVPCAPCLQGPNITVLATVYGTYIKSFYHFNSKPLYNMISRVLPLLKTPFLSLFLMQPVMIEIPVSHGILKMFI